MNNGVLAENLHAVDYSPLANTSQMAVARQRSHLRLVVGSQERPSNKTRPPAVADSFQSARDPDIHYHMPPPFEIPGICAGLKPTADIITQGAITKADTREEHVHLDDSHEPDLPPPFFIPGIRLGDNGDVE